MRAMKSTDLLKLVLAIVAFGIGVRGIAVGISEIAAQNRETFSGEIVDSNCPNSASDAGAVKSSFNSRDCTLACVHNGAKLVLYDAANKKIYKLDDQKKPAEFAGDRVRVIGTLNKATNTIHVTTVEGNR